MVHSHYVIYYLGTGQTFSQMEQRLFFFFKDKLIGLLVYLWFLSQSFLAENGFNDYLL